MAFIDRLLLTPFVLSDSTFGKVGGDVVLTPSTVSDTITGVLWYCGPNFAAEWMGGKTTFYGNFKSTLNWALQRFLLVCSVPEW